MSRIGGNVGEVDGVGGERGSGGISLHIGDKYENAFVDKYIDGIDDGIMQVITNV